MSKKKLIISIIIIAGLLAILVFKTKSKALPAEDSTSFTALEGSSTLESGFISALLSVKNINLDTGLLSSSVFKSLKSSGVIIDTNPAKGRTDPFAPLNFKSSNVLEVDQTLSSNNSIRSTDLGIGAQTNDLLAGVSINISKITSSTAVLSIKGLPEDTFVKVNIEKGDGEIKTISSFVYKPLSREYTAVATGLSSKIKYSASIVEPEVFKDIYLDFQTK